MMMMMMMMTTTTTIGKDSVPLNGLCVSILAISSAYFCNKSAP